MITIEKVRRRLKENGFRWTLYFALFRALDPMFRGVLSRLERRMANLELRYRLPGRNTKRNNYETWQHWNWSQGGEEWTQSPEWKQSVVDDVMRRWVEPDKTVLEIGPGAGRWTEYLQKLAAKLIVVDLAGNCIDICKKRFSDCANVEYHVNDGRSLDFLGSDSVDFIWSYDVFVHIAPRETEDYLREIQRVLREGGRAVIHHPQQGGIHGGWRSSMTIELFSELLGKQGFKILSQFDSWGPGGRFNIHYTHDAISVFEKQRPAPSAKEPPR